MRIIDSKNDTTAALSGGETFTGKWEEVVDYNTLGVAVITDQDGTLYVDQSTDTVNSDSTLTFNVSATTNEVHRVVIVRKYYRVRYVNGSVAQSYLRIQSRVADHGLLNSPLNSPAQQDADSIVVKPIDYFINVNAGLYSGLSIVQKFGANADVDAAEDVSDTGDASYTGWPTGAETVGVLSSDVNDTAAGTGARTVKIFGLDANYALQEETVSLNGTNQVTTVNTFLRVYRATVITAGSGTTNAGTITVRQSTTTTNIFSKITAGYGQRQITNYTVPAGHNLYLLHYDAQILDATSNSANLVIKYRELNGAVRLIRQFSASTTSPFKDEVWGGMKIPEKTDFIFRVLSVQNANATITVTWDAILIKS